jgi:hypothetical protein
MDRSIRPIDTYHEAIKAMAGALSDMGYTRDSDYPEPADIRAAVGAMLEKLADLQDFSFAFEFITEGRVFADSRIIRGLAECMSRPSQSASEGLANELVTRARWYGDSYLEEAMAMLDSASEIEQDRKVDQDIDERKEQMA